MTKAWSARTDWQTVCRRSAGRRAYNSRRQFLALLRQREVARLLHVQEAFPKRGTQAWLAQLFGVSRATVCRDIKALLRSGRRCSQCGALTTPPRTEFPYDYGPPDLDRPAPRRSLSAYLQDPLNDDGARRGTELEKNPAVVLLRHEYDRLGLPQPETLDGVDVIEECMRLAGVPTPAALPAGLKELPAPDPTAAHSPDAFTSRYAKQESASR